MTSRTNSWVSMSLITVTVAVVLLTATARQGGAAELAEGVAVDAQQLRWDREKKFFATESKRIRAEIGALGDLDAGDPDERSRKYRKWVTLTRSYFEAVAGLYGAYGRQLDYKVEKYRDGAQSLGQAVEESMSARAEMQRGQAEVGELRKASLRCTVLAPEVNDVLGESVVNATACENMLALSEANLARFETVAAGFDRSAEQWTRDRGMLEAEVRRMTVARRLAGLYEQVYSKAANAYERMEAVADVHVEGLGEVDFPDMGEMPELPPALGVSPDRPETHPATWNDRASELEQLEQEHGGQ